MEEMIFEMLLHLSIYYPPRALQPDLIKGHFQPCGEGGNLLMVTLHNFIKFYMRMLNDTTVPKITVSFCTIWATLVVGPCTWPYQLLSPLAIILCFPRPPIPDNGL